MSCCDDKQAYETARRLEVQAIMRKLDNLDDDNARVLLKLEFLLILQDLENIEAKQPC